MNIFVFDERPEVCARQHCDRHVVKMVLETAQILCTVQHLAGNSPPYRKTHANHPCVHWATESEANYRWLVALGRALADEYTYRYGRRHKSQDVIEWCAEREPELPPIPRTKFALVMPDEYRLSSPEESYRRYFCAEKSHLGQWTDREMPVWFSACSGEL